MLRIKITAGDVVAFAELDQTSTAQAIWNALPIEARANTWGDEIRPASAVNVSGRLEGDPAIFKRVRSGEQVVLERVE